MTIIKNHFEVFLVTSKKQEWLYVEWYIKEVGSIVVPRGGFTCQDTLTLRISEFGVPRIHINL
jgi:hypothetical protein